MRIVVQKFGGTSVATPSARELVVKHVLNKINEGYKTVVVVSAMGRMGDPYATDTLLSLLNGRKMEARERDLLISCGEIISASVMAALFADKGYKAKAFTGFQAGIITDNNFGNAKILDIKPEKILQALQEGIIPVVAGFQGYTEDLEITTLGRGGSDTTAVALGAALKAECVEIFTDVEGIMTADPKLVNNAKMLDEVNYREVTEMAYNGAKVIHPRAVELAMQHNIPLRVRSTFSDNQGTLIKLGPEKVVTGIAHTTHIAQLKIEVPSNDKELESKIFESLAQKGISIDMINIFPDVKIFTLAEDVVSKATEVLKELGVSFEVTKNLAKVTVVGGGMMGIPGVMLSIIEALKKENIDILQTSDSHTTISCLIKEEDVKKAVLALHEKFEL
mgnify:CR=1 FL=1